jgi:hypothetical protein
VFFHFIELSASLQPICDHISQCGAARAYIALAVLSLGSTPPSFFTSTSIELLADECASLFSAFYCSNGGNCVYQQCGNENQSPILGKS